MDKIVEEGWEGERNTHPPNTVFGTNPSCTQSTQTGIVEKNTPTNAKRDWLDEENTVRLLSTVRETKKITNMTVKYTNASVNPNSSNPAYKTNEPNKMTQHTPNPNSRRKEETK